MADFSEPDFGDGDAEPDFGGFGHNGGPALDDFSGEEVGKMDVMNSNTAKQLLTVVERIERLEEDKAGITDDIKEVYAEAKGNGFDTKIIRQTVRNRKIDKVKREEQQQLLELYEAALEMVKP